MKRIPDLPDLQGLMGQDHAAACERFSEGTDRRVGEERWLMLLGEGWQLRVISRRGDTGPHRVACWILSLGDGAGRLREVVEPLGLWPALAPDETAPRQGLVRRVFVRGDETFSFTATARSGGFRTFSLFDESPEWLTSQDAS